VTTHSYAQELHSRFTKDIIKAAQQKDNTNTVAMSGLQRVLTNINMLDRISEQEMKTIFHEMGCSSGMISADKMMKLL
jgi:hypothetical protein